MHTNLIYTVLLYEKLDVFWHNSESLPIVTKLKEVVIVALHEETEYVRYVHHPLRMNTTLLLFVIFIKSRVKYPPRQYTISSPVPNLTGLLVRVMNKYRLNLLCSCIMPWRGA